MIYKITINQVVIPTTHCRFFKQFKSKIVAFLFIVCFVLETNAQQQHDSINIEHQIVAVARPQKSGEIMIRWAVTSARAWRKLNTYGYNVKRYTLTRNKKTLALPEEKDMGVFKSKPLEEWMTVIESNNNAAVMAQSLYGERFNVEGQDKLSAIINLAEEQTQRFTWGLYAADQDFMTAQMAGLGFVDTNVISNEKYVYKIIPLVPKNELVIKEGGVFVGLQDYDILPKPLDLAGVYLDGKTMLSWNYEIHKELYNSYFVERSIDGKHFTRLNDLPFNNLNNTNKRDTKRMFYIDSITNNRTYHYRILGKTIFGELSPVSEVVSGQGKEILAYVPKITTKHYLDDKRIILEWEFLKEGNQQITGFELNRSDEVKGNYKVVMENIPPEARKIQYDDLQTTNYLTITAIGKNGDKRTSFPALIQPVDSIPPTQPKGIRGSVDSLGIVTLKWTPNTEKDMLGYRIFRGNNKKEEYSQITVAPHQGTVYYDSVSVKNLNAKVFYKLIAVDQRFNMSTPSEILELKKPDFIKPTQPVFQTYKIESGKVYLKWALSSSQDVIQHDIYRRAATETEWVLVHTVNNNDLRTSKATVPSNINDNGAFADWTDVNVEATKRYNYTIIAIDDSGLESDPAPPLTLEVPKTDILEAIRNFNNEIDKKGGYITLYWKLSKAIDVAEIQIYKGIKDKPISLLSNIRPNIENIIDYKVKPNNIYRYIIRAVFKDGQVSASKQMTIKF